MSFPSPPYSDNQTTTLDGVTYIYELANNRWKVKTNDVSAFTAAVGSNAQLTPDKLNFAVSFLNTPPGTPSTGQAVVVGSSPTGSFVGHANALAVYNGSSWQFTAAYEGLVVWDQDNNIYKAWDGSAWSAAVPASATPPDAGSITSAMLANGLIAPDKLGLKIVSRALTSAPSSLGASGAQYIVKATPAGGDAWFGQAGKLATKTGSGDTAADWTFESLASGRLYWIDNEGVLVGYNGSAQVNIGPAKGGDNVPATALDDLAGLVATQARSIVAAIDTDNVGGGALLTLKAALGVGNFHYTLAFLGVGSFAISNTTTGATGSAVWSAPTGAVSSLADGAKDHAVQAGSGIFLTGIAPFTSFTKSLVSWSTSGGGTGVWDITFNASFANATDYKVLDALSESYGSYTCAISNKTASGFRISVTNASSPASVGFSIYALN